MRSGGQRSGGQGEVSAADRRGDRHAPDPQDRRELDEPVRDEFAQLSERWSRERPPGDHG